MKVSADTDGFATKETEVSEVTVPSEGSEETTTPRSQVPTTGRSREEP